MRRKPSSRSTNLESPLESWPCSTTLLEPRPSPALQPLASFGAWTETLSIISSKGQSKLKEKSMMTFWRRWASWRQWRSTRGLRWQMLSKKSGSKQENTSLNREIKREALSTWSLRDTVSLPRLSSQEKRHWLWRTTSQVTTSERGLSSDTLPEQQTSSLKVKFVSFLLIAKLSSV